MAGFKKINKLDELLVEKLKDSISNASGNDWKKQWRCTDGMPVNGKTGLPFSSAKTTLLLFLRQKELAAKGVKGNRWFTFKTVADIKDEKHKKALWKDPEYIYSRYKDKEHFFYKDIKDVKDSNGENLVLYKFKKSEKDKWEDKSIKGNKKDFEDNLVKMGFYKKIIPTPVLAYSESPLYVVKYEDPNSKETETFYYKAKNRMVVYYSELKKDVIPLLLSKGVNPDTIEQRYAGNDVDAIYHESQLDPIKLEKFINTPTVKENTRLSDLNIGVVHQIADGIKLNKLIIDDRISLDKAYYHPEKDQVVLPSVTSFKDKESFFATAFHELTHATGSKSRLNRNLNNSFGSPEYAREELVAEIGSILICNEHGVNSEKQMQNHGEYLKNWLNSFAEADKEKQDREILKAISQATKAYEYIDSTLDKSLEKQKVIVNDDDVTDKSVKLDNVLVGTQKISEKILEDEENEKKFKDHEREISLGGNLWNI